MKALRFTGERSVAVGEKPDPRPGPGEVLIRMRATAICGSDLHIYRRPRAPFLDGPITPGHEPCGEIVELGPEVRGWSAGDRVVVYFRRTCGVCDFCRTGQNQVCRTVRPGYGFGADGSHGELMTADASALMRLPDGLSYQEGAILACQGGTAYAPLVRLNVSGRDTLAVSGLGPVGLLSTMFGVAMGARVIGIDPAEGRRALAKQLGAAVTLDPAAGNIVEQVREHCPDGADKISETSGASAAHATIPTMLRPLGTAALVGLGTEQFAASLGDLTRWDITVFGSTIYPQSRWEEICRFVQTKGLNLGAIVSHDLHLLADGARGYQLAEQADTGKVCFHLE